MTIKISKLFKTIMEIRQLSIDDKYDRKKSISVKQGLNKHIDFNESLQFLLFVLKKIIILEIN